MLITITVSDTIAVLALAISLITLLASKRLSEQSVRAAMFDKRYEVFEEAEEFIAAWLRHGRPDLDKLGSLVGAWNRSHFLFRPEVTNYLRKLWTDSLDAEQAQRIISGDAEGDHLEAVYNKYERLRETADFDKLRKVFMDDLKV